MRSVGLFAVAVLTVILVTSSFSPVFAPLDGAYVTLTPISGCPGTPVELDAYFPFDDLAIALNGGDEIPVSISSVPGGLISQLDCSLLIDFSIEVGCTFVVSESACSGPNTVIVTFVGAIDSITFEPVSASFEVPSTCGRACPVGGCVQPVNPVALVAPWLAVIGLVGCVGTVAIVVRKRPP